jgi:hypothetical protein
VKNPACRPNRTRLRAWIAVGTGIAAGWAFLIGLYLGFAG